MRQGSHKQKNRSEVRGGKKSSTDKKGQGEQEPELTPALSGEEEVSPLLPDHEIIQRK